MPRLIMRLGLVLALALRVGVANADCDAPIQQEFSSFSVNGCGVGPQRYACGGSKPVHRCYSAAATTPLRRRPRPARSSPAA